MIMLSNVGWNSGLREWILQRFTGLYIAFYVFFVVFYLSFNGGLTHLNWVTLFSAFYFKIITVIFVFTLVLHSSIGMSIILTDYIKNTVIRVFLDFIVNLVLLAYIFCIMQILWGFK